MSTPNRLQGNAASPAPIGLPHGYSLFYRGFRCPACYPWAVEVSRFAPSTTGPAHPGTLLAALVCWLDARSRGARLVLRLEDLDPERCRPAWSAGMVEALAWLGLDWDRVFAQSSRAADHAAVLDRLAASGLLYPCGCTRGDLRADPELALTEGGFAYPGTCRGRVLPSAGWRATPEPLRVRLPEGQIAIADESGIDLSGDPGRAPGDPVVRRRDGAIAYHLAGVVDDAAESVTRVVRGRDLATTTATQVALQRLLGAPTPHYRHHLLLLERRGAKLAKLHGAVGFGLLRAAYSADALCGVLAHAAHLRPSAEPVTPRALLADFAWERVRTLDRVLQWTGGELIAD
jgi:glutamyl-Q tRNA(Asp) synthetase